MHAGLYLLKTVPVALYQALRASPKHLAPTAGEELLLRIGPRDQPSYQPLLPRPRFRRLI